MPAALTRPRPPRLSRRLADGEIDVPAESARLDDLRLADADWREARITFARVDGCVFERGQLGDSHWRGVLLRDVTFQATSLANARWDAATLERCAFRGCQLTGWHLDGDCTLEDVLFEDCRLDLAVWRYLQCRRVALVRCRLLDADLQGTQWHQSWFVDCALERTEFSHGRLAGTDLRGSQLDSARLGSDEIRGAILDPLQAISVAADVLQVDVRWGDTPLEPPTRSEP